MIFAIFITFVVVDLWIDQILYLERNGIFIWINILHLAKLMLKHNF